MQRPASLLLLIALAAVVPGGQGFLLPTQQSVHQRSVLESVNWPLQLDMADRHPCHTHM